jgi:hypothetical protein
LAVFSAEPTDNLPLCKKSFFYLRIEKTAQTVGGLGQVPFFFVAVVLALNALKVSPVLLKTNLTRDF